MAQNHIVCGNCGQKLYQFSEIVIVTPDNDIVVRPEVSGKPRKEVWRNDKSSDSSSYCPKTLICSHCRESIGRTQRDSVFQTMTDRIHGKSVKLEIQGQGTISVKKWDEQIPLLISLGMECITVAELTNKTKGNYSSRENEPVFPTVLVDVDNTPASTLESLFADKTPRNYQLEMIQHGLRRNSLICLPTGSGKTLVSAGVIAAMLHVNPRKVVAFVVKTNTLAEQQSHALAEELTKSRIQTYSGQMDPEMKSASLKKIGKFDYDVLVVTCECMNLLVDVSTVRIEDLCCLVLDEAHHTKKKDPYNVLLRKVYEGAIPEENRPLVLGLTASPVDEKPKGQMEQALEDKIIELSSSLGCMATYPLKHDPYKNGISQTQDFTAIKSGDENEEKFRRQLDDYLLSLLDATTGEISQVSEEFGKLRTAFIESRKTGDTNRFRGIVREVEKVLDRERDTRTSESERLIITKGYAIRNHINQILAVHEMNSVIGYELGKARMKDIFDNIEDPSPGQQTTQKVVLTEAGVNGQPLYSQFYKDLKSIPKGDEFGKHNLSVVCKKIIYLVENHYKEQKEASRILVFVSMRRTAKQLCECLRRLPNLRAYFNPDVIVGRGLQGDGLTIEEQKEILKDFRKGLTRLLITTTILEEGLDVTQCNMVIRLSAPQNLREFIQSRGRACRSKNGKFHIICKNNDERAQQQEFANYMDKQPEIIRRRMEQLLSDGLMEKQGHERKVIDLEEDPGRADYVVEKTMTEAEQDDEDIEELLNLMAEAEMQPEQQDDMRFLDEYEPGEVALSLRFAWWPKDPDPKTIQKYYKRVQRMTEEFTQSELQGEWQNVELRANTLLLGTIYYPEAKFASTDAKGVDELGMFERNLIGGFFMSKTMDSAAYDLWVSVKTPVCYYPKTTALRLSLKRVNVGSLIGPKKFVSYTTLGSTARLLVDRSSDNICITINDNFRIEACFKDIQSFIVVDKLDRESEKEDPIVRLHFTFTQPPRFSTLSEPGKEDKRTIIRESNFQENEYTRKILGNCLTYQLEVPNIITSATKDNLFEHRIRQVLRLMESSGKTVYYTRIVSESAIEEIPDDDEGLRREQTIHHNSKEVNYAMKCVQSTKGFMYGRQLDNQFFDLLNQVSEDRAASALYQLAEVLERKMFCDYTEELEKIMSNLRAKPFFPQVFGSKNHRYMKRAVITPTRILYYKPDYIQTNRTVRNNGEENFVRVGIRDETSENLTGLHGHLTKVMNRVNEILTNGIKIGNVEYHYLASSSSQLRGHSCYFIEEKGHNTASQIRAEQGNLSEITTVGKYVARMGLGFSTSEKTILVSSYETESDIIRNKFTFSDGIGLIASSTAEKVMKKLKLQTLPSAFQIRLGGCKGMLTVWSDEFMRQKGYYQNIVVRESMLKFTSNHMSLEVLEKTKPLRLHLNHQVIMLLNNVGVPDDTFMKLLQKDIDDLSTMFSDEIAAKEVLKSIVARQVKDLETVKFGFTTDPFFRELMMAFYRVKMKDLRVRSRVRMDPSKARVLMGVLDETGTLEPGQVFIQISKHLDFPKSDLRVIQSPIVIMKNPCIHPGDVRTFKGVNLPQLKHLYDCVVFPQKGDRPHPNELSGSDLDGDQYHCIWDPELLPVIPIKEPMSYENTHEPDKFEHIGVKQMIEYTCKYIENDTLGMIDNTHKALADQLGIEDEECLKLAVIHAKAVDAPKSGDWQEVPRESYDLLKKYPDFMMKLDKPSYPSYNVLGKMFRECNKYISDALDPSSQSISADVCPDDAFEVPGHEKFYEDAKQTYEEYCDGLETIMKMYGIKTEAELISGHISDVHSRLTEELDDVIKNSKVLMDQIVKAYRKRFFDDPRLEGTNKDAKHFEKASAWYLAAYGKDRSKEFEIRTTRFLSFPWIVSEILAKIFLSNTELNNRIKKSPELAISKSIGDLYFDVAHDLITSYEKHRQLQEYISETARRFGICFLTGLTSTFLFDRIYGEVNILLLKKPTNYRTTNQDYKLPFLRRLRIALKPVTSKEALDSGRLHLRLELKDHALSKRRADVTTDFISTYIWAIIKAYIFQQPWLHPILRLLCSWIRTVGLVGGRRMFLPDYLIPCLFIDHCLALKVFKGVNHQEVFRDSDRFLEDPRSINPLGTVQQWERLFMGLKKAVNESSNPYAWDKHPANTGKLLISFMKAGKEHLSRVVHTSFSECLSIQYWNQIEQQDRLELLIAEMEKASHRLVMHVSASALLKTVKIQKLFFLKLEAARVLAGNEDTIAKTLNMKCGAKIDIQTKMSNKTTDSGMIVTAYGTEVELYLLGKEIKLLNRQLEADRKRTRSVRVLGLKDMPGAHNLLIDGANSEEQCMIRLEPYYGIKYPQHDYKNLHVVRLFGSSKSALDSAAVDSPVAYSFRKHLERQLKTFDNKFSEAVYGDCELQIKFGRAYVVSPPRSFTEESYGLTVNDLLRTLENRRGREVDPTWESVMQRKQSNYSAKPSTEGSISTSFVSSIVFDSDVQTRVKELAKNSNPIKAEKGVKMYVEQNFGTVTARYTGKEMKYAGLETSPFRWVVSDIKRHCKSSGVNAEGDECDIRFLMKTQVKEVENVDNHAQDWGFEDALGRDKNKKLVVLKDELDVKFIEDYSAAVYEMKPTPLGIPYNVMIRNATQYTRRMHVQGKGVVFTSMKDVYELRIIPEVSYLINSESRNDTMDSLWELAFQYSNFLKADTQDTTK
eukprot:g2625.t1